MQLRELEIDRFGVWQDVTFPFNHRGITVLYGPNEAGKSTLMRFIRGVLYGYQPHDERSAGPNSEPVECSGTLRLHHQGQDYRIRRTSFPGTRGRLEINGRFVKDDDPLLQSIVSHTAEATFQNIFAIGLNELQQLSALHGDDVARHIYGLSLGPEGEQIFRAHNGLANDERRILGDKPRDGELFKHVAQLAALDRELARHGPATEKYTRLQSNQRDLENDIADLQERQSELTFNLRGRTFVSKVWGPWSKERDIQAQLKTLPQGDLDREILNQFDQLELQLSEIDDRRKTLIAEAKQHQADAEAIVTRPELEEHGCTIQNLFERSRVMQGLDRALQNAPGGAATDRAIQEMLNKLDGRWDLRRLEQTEINAPTWMRLTQEANAYRAAVRSRGRLVKRTRQVNAVLRRLKAEWKAHTKDLGEQSIADARKSLQRRLHELEELRGLRAKRDHLKKTLDFFNRDLGPKMVIRDLPPFFWLILSFFLFAGMILLFGGIYAAMRGYIGFVAGGPAALIIGGAFAFLGLAAICTFWTMKEYFETVDFEPPDSAAERESLELELHRAEQAIERIIRREHQAPAGPPPKPGEEAPPQPTEEEQIKQIRQQLFELDQHEPIGLKIDALRRRLASMRLALQDRQRTLGRTRRDWTELLRRIGITETLKISQAFEECRILGEAHEQLQIRNSLSEKENYQRQEVEAYHRQIRELALKLEDRDFKLGDLYEALATWDRELKLQGERRRERMRLRQLAKEKRQQSAELASQIEKFRRERGTLLKRLGVAERGEIIAKLAAIDERNTLEFQLKEIRQQIQQLVDADSDLAIVEEDLIAYDAEKNAELIDQIRREQEKISQSLKEAQARLNDVRNQLREIEEDRTLTSLRFDREQVFHGLMQATENWAATRLADKVVDRLRHRIEQDRQPHMLQAASNYLQRFTLGKYTRIWTRLGEKALLVDDDQGQSLRVEHLSSGTREQVFLSVRLAMIRDFARKGTEMPIVLDDVTVNFDQTRTEAAAQTLMEVAQQGQQILVLTCHLHFAQIFQQKGHEPIWLPALRAESQLQRQ